MVIVTDSPNSYGHDVKLLVEHHGATVRAMHPRLGEHQMRSKLSLLPVLLPNLFAYRSAWREGDDVVVISWYIVPVLVLLKLRLVHQPRRIVAWGNIVQSRKMREGFAAFLRWFADDRLYFVADSSVEEEAVLRRGGLRRDRVIMLPFREVVGLPLGKATGEDYVFTGGYTNRDYDLFLEVAKGLEEKVEISATEANGLPADLPDHIRVDTTFAPGRFEEMVAGSRLVVIPLKASGGGSGHSVLLQALKYHKPVIVTRHPAIIDTLGDDYLGYVEPGDLEGLRTAVDRALHDPEFDRALRAASIEGRAVVDAWPPMADEIVSIIETGHEKTIDLGGAQVVVLPAGAEADTDADTDIDANADIDVDAGESRAVGE